MWYYILTGKEPLPVTGETMGYTTEFEGRIDLDRELTASETAAITAFSEERHGANIGGYTTRVQGYWCNWVPTADGRGIEWNGGEKFYDADQWMQLVIDEFIKPAGITANGTINAEGESSGDIWRLHVENNVVRVARARITWADS